MRLLLVEDNKINQMVAQRLLGQEGADITLAENGALGVQAAMARLVHGRCAPGLPPPWGGPRR
jgi:CheY-like chemotaxis protein